MFTQNINNALARAMKEKSLCDLYYET